MQTTAKLDAVQVRAVLRELKNIDPESVKDLRKDLRSRLVPFAAQIASVVPVDPPLSGLANNGATAWGPVAGKVGFTPGKSRRNAKNLVAIRIDPINKKRGLYIAELAGSRSAGATPQGANLISVLNQRKPMKGRGGRFAYNQFRLLRPDILKTAETILNETFARINRKIN